MAREEPQASRRLLDTDSPSVEGTQKSSFVSFLNQFFNSGE